jgi:hypothetical protein
VPTFRSGDLQAGAANGAVPPLIDTLIVDRAVFESSKDRWRISGEATQVGPGNTVSIHLGPTVNGVVIGTVEVDELGGWDYDERFSSNPPNGETQISVSSSANGAAEFIDIAFD